MTLKEGRKKVIFEIDVNLHCEIKASAARRNISMALWMQRAFLERLQKEKHYDKENDVR